MTEFIIQLTVDIPRDVVELLGEEIIATGLESKFAEALNVALPQYASHFRVEVGTADGPESDAGETESAPTTPARVAPSARPTVAHKTAQNASKGGPSGRTGRPATLHNLVAEDGEPVRAAGPRSRENLESQGIAVWDTDKGETGPAPVKRNTGERVAPQRAGKPVMRQRGK